LPVNVYLLLDILSIMKNNQTKSVFIMRKLVKIGETLRYQTAVKSG